MEIPRPSLGRLVASSGEVVQLDRDVVLGRDPKVPTGHSGGMPHLVRLKDPRKEVSSQHALITVDYWQVSITDLASTNGTEIVLPDGRRHRLPPNQATVIDPGTTVVLAEILNLRFEATP